MMQSAILWILRHDRAVLFVTFVAAALGAWSLSQTPIDALPDLSENQVLVYTPWPGQRPPEIEQQVTRPLAQALQGIAGLVTVRGSSEVNFSLLHLIFADDVSFLEARKRVQARLAELAFNFPSGVTPQLAADGIPTGQIFWYSVEGRDTNLMELRRIQDESVAPALRTIPGVAEVASIGGFQAEYHFELDLKQLANAKISLTDLQSSLGTMTSANEIQERELGRLVLGTAPRSGVFEKDGSEVVAGIVHLRYGHNPLSVTREIIDRLQQISDGLSTNVRLIPCYDRTPLILGAVRTVTNTLLESMLVTALCVVLVLRHWRTSLVISLTLPLAVLGAFLAIGLLRATGINDIQTNIMSLAGIVVSIGVLVDSAIVITDNVSHQLREQFGDQPVTGDTRLVVARACATVGLPAFLAIVVMLVSFLPVFSLQGLDGRMYGPLAWTKALSLLSVAVLTISVVPVLCHILIRGRIRPEGESAIVQTFVRVYRPLLDYLLDHPLPLVLFLGVTLILGAATTGNDWLVRIAVGVSLGACWYVSQHRRSLAISISVVLLAGLAGPTWMRPIGLSLRVPLDEGMVMDMPITVPNITIAQAGDDLKIRNMILCRFPEVAMVTGKAGRAETAFDPAPMDMIETMVEFRPIDQWPQRRLTKADATDQAIALTTALQAAQLIEASDNIPALANEIVDTGLPRFDAVQREVCWQRLQVLQKELGRTLAIELTTELATRLLRTGDLNRPLTNAEIHGIVSELPTTDVRRLGQQLDRVTIYVLIKQLFHKLHPSVSLPSTLAEEMLVRLRQVTNQQWRTFVQKLNAELRQRAPGTWTQIVCSELVLRQPIKDDALRQTWNQILLARYGTTVQPISGNTHEHVGLPSISRLPIIDPHREYDGIVRRLTEQFASRVSLWSHDRNTLTSNSGELDVSVRMPGWANVWTRPIQNRVDMLASGVNSEVGVRVMGDNFDQVVEVSEAIANVLRMVPGAADVVADPIRGKDYSDWIPDAEQMASLGIEFSESKLLSEISSPGRLVGKVVGADGELPLRLKLAGPTLDSLGEIKIRTGPATIKSENGSLRNYVRFNVRDRDPKAVIADARREIERQVVLPPGMFLEWTGQFEHAARTRQKLLWMIPVVLLLIAAILFAVFRDVADAALMLMSIPGALAGGALCQWVFGFPFSVAVGIGYIACFGMAAATSMIMLVYLRESVARAGDLATLSVADLRSAVIDGAVQRLRPKLLTEATMIFSLTPMLWSTGAGADVIRPMAAPVLGGILIADEVVDLLIPLLFFAVRRQRQKTLAARTEDLPVGEIELC